MGISTQRLLIIVIAINLIMSLSYAIYEAPRVIDYGVFSESIDLGETSATNIESETSRIAPENLQEEGSYTNALRVGSIIFGLFIRGMVALPFSTDGLGTGLEVIVITALIIFKSLMYMLIILELYMLYKNKKTN